MGFPTDVANIDECLKRMNRTLMTTDSYVITLSSPPKKRSYNSDQELRDLILEADELLCWDVRNSVGHPWAPTFFDSNCCGILRHLNKIKPSDAPLHAVEWLDTSTWRASVECDKADIVEAVRDYTLYGAAASDTYGFHNIVGNILYTTSPSVRVTQANWGRDTACQSPITFTTAIIMLAIALSPKDGLDTNLLNYCDRKSAEFRQMIRGGDMLLPEVTQFGLGETAP